MTSSEIFFRSIKKLVLEFIGRDKMVFREARDMNQLLIWLFLIFAMLLTACIFNTAPSDLTPFHFCPWCGKKLS